MLTMFSSIRTRVVPPELQSQFAPVLAQSRQQAVGQARAIIALQGVPGEYDFRKFITPALETMVPVHYAVGGASVGSLAVNTNPNQWRDYDPGRYSGLFSPAGEYAAPPTSIITLVQDLENGGYMPHEESAVPDVTVPPTKAVLIQKNSTRAFSINVLQGTDPA